MAVLTDLRAYLAGLGTTAVLALGAFILLVTVTSLVAFSGWSLGGRADGAGDLVLKDAPASQRRAGPPPRAAAPRAARAAAARAPTPASGATSGDRVSGGTSPSRPLPAAAPRVDAGQPAPPGGDFGPVSPPAVPPTSPPPTTPTPPIVTVPELRLRRVTQRLGQTTKDLTADLGVVVEQVDPRLGETVFDTGEVLGDVVGNLGGSY